MVEAPDRGFREPEFHARLARAQALMADHDLDAMLLMTEPEIRYFSGFQTLFWQSPTRPWFLIVPALGKPMAVILEIGAALMGQSWLDDIRTWSAPSPEDDGISLLVEALSPLAGRNSRLGILKGPETVLRMPLADYERLLGALPGIQIADATPLVRALRMVKSPAEIEKIAHICGIASRTFAEVPSLVSVGMPQIEAFRAFRQAALAKGADDVPYLVGGAGLGGYGDVIAPSSQRPLAPGDILMLDTGCIWDGYFCDFDRNFAIGQADDQARRVYDTLWRATEAGLAAACPGATCRDLFHAMRSVISEIDPSGAGIGRLGHGLGMQLTEWPSHAVWDRTILQENMVLTLEPSLSYGDGHTMVHEENIVIQAGSPRILTDRASTALPVI